MTLVHVEVVALERALVHSRVNGELAHTVLGFGRVLNQHLPVGRRGGLDHCIVFVFPEIKLGHEGRVGVARAWYRAVEQFPQGCF